MRKFRVQIRKPTDSGVELETFVVTTPPSYTKAQVDEIVNNVILGGQAIPDPKINIMKVEFSARPEETELKGVRITPKGELIKN